MNDLDLRRRLLAADAALPPPPALPWSTAHLQARQHRRRRRTALTAAAAFVLLAGLCALLLEIPRPRPGANALAALRAELTSALQATELQLQALDEERADRARVQRRATLADTRIRIAGAQATALLADPTQAPTHR